MQDASAAPSQSQEVPEVQERAEAVQAVQADGDHVRGRQESLGRDEPGQRQQTLGPLPQLAQPDGDERAAALGRADRLPAGRVSMLRRQGQLPRGGEEPRVKRSDLIGGYKRHVMSSKLNLIGCFID